MMSVEKVKVEKGEQLQSAINEARRRACVLVEAVNVYRVEVKPGGTTLYGLVYEGESEEEGMKLLRAYGTVIESVYRATPPQWN